MNNKLLIIISLIFLILLGLKAPVFAITANEVREQIDDINDQIKELDREIAKYQAELNKTGQQKNTLNTAIQELTITRNQLLAERTQIQKKINVTTLVINELGDNIKTKEESIQKSEASIKKMLYSLYQTEKDSFIERLLSRDKIETLSREYNDTLAINEQTREHINELLNQKKELSNSKNEKQSEQDKLNNLKKTLVAKETAVLNTKKEKDTLLIQTKNKEAEYQKLLAEQIKRKETFEKELEEYESKLKFILDPNSIPKAGSGVLSWPLNSILVTSLYGDRCLVKLYGTCKFHYGLDFRAAVGTPVMAVASGIIEGFGDTDLSCPKASFGKWIFIRHDNGLSSTYGHLSATSVKVGQVVKAGDIIGLSGNTGASTGPHLHLSVYASGGVKIDTVPSKSCVDPKTKIPKIFTQPIAATNAYLDPALYLPSITSSMVKK